ncbi:Extracellular solute-binding protein, family 3 precursor [Leucobacter sp. 7(1)]|uniref:transporter substrate-binding domain-containing protein n=1 Tax=Leucobacter sp. 7(1) TaxID=1255613 RepID=UPI00097E988E|nr:transporter substrate-binding domain-containing protein [Leucobacter sp. 7(1)]SJN11089.1 Extracellular solute-binding protein, family 3 precursor [Leucobacter sp. 7(1)]
MTKHVRTRIGAIALVLGAGVLGLTGCSAPADAETGSRPAAEGSGSTLPTIEAGAFTCSMSGEYRPFNYFDEAGELVGFDVDICTAIAEEIGLEAKPVTAPFNSLIGGLQANRADAIIGSLAATEERKQQVLFTEPYYETGASLFVPAGSKITSIDELDGAKVGVTLGTTFEEYAQGRDNISEVRTYQADPDALKDLESGRIDGVITQGFIGNYLAKNAGFKVQEVGDVLIPDVAAIAVGKDNTKLRDAIDAALVTLHEDGTYDALSQEWFGESLG